MNSVILQISSTYLRFLLILIAILSLLRGHNMPGGGFIGGLLASLAVIVSSLAYSPQYMLRHLKVRPKTHVAIGLSLVTFSVLPSILTGNNLMKGVWIKVSIPMISEVKIGTPLLFDTGVFFIVIGITLLLFFSLSNKK